MSIAGAEHIQTQLTPETIVGVVKQIVTELGGLAVISTKTMSEEEIKAERAGHEKAQEYAVSLVDNDQI